MNKLNQLLAAAREKGWTVDDPHSADYMRLTRDAVAGEEQVDIYLTQHRPPRMHHTWYSLNEHDTRYDSSQYTELLDRITDPSGLEA